MIYSHESPELRNKCGAPGCREVTGDRWKPEDSADAIGGFWYTHACCSYHAEEARLFEENKLPKHLRVRRNGRR